MIVKSVIINSMTTSHKNLIGARARVVGLCDEVGNPKHIGKEGVITGLDTYTCGSTEDDPFLLLLLPDGTTDGFWKEELELSQARESENVTHTQLLGIIARLRGCVTSLLMEMSEATEDRDTEIRQARALLNLTALSLSEKDEVDGGFDDSFMVGIHDVLASC